MNYSSSKSDLTDDEDPDLEMESGLVFTRLTEIVRKHYFCFLEKLLKENYEVWCKSTNQIQEESRISACAKLLEDRAIRACMVMQIYRQIMVKIIASVRRSTQQCRLQHNLRNLIEKQSEQETLKPKYVSKSTQTENTPNNVDSAPQIPAVNDDCVSPSLQRKMEMFQEKLNNDIAENIAAKGKKIIKSSPRPKRSRRSSKKPLVGAASRHAYSRHPSKSRPLTQCYKVSPSPTNPEKKDNNDDKIAQELAQLFSEEKNEIDEIFGYLGNEEPEDPRISSILKEIENAKLPSEQKNLKTPHAENYVEDKYTDSAPYATLKDESVMEECEKPKADLRNSLWPCELYMQSRKLSEVLSRLIEEDFRWHDIMKWKFVTLFGEDSDDEFACLSPSIELDEVLMCSCIKRISPWVVQHLMKPMKDGLIANRFLFKKLAKKLSRLIILENQYPDEKMVKTVVENFFCIRQGVSSVEDLELPSIMCKGGTLFDE